MTETVPTYTCDPHCPVATICGMQQQIYEGARNALFGDGEQPGMAGLAMTASEETRQAGLEDHPDIADKIAATREGVLSLVEQVERLKPKEFDQAALRAQCSDGPAENRAGLAFGFDATLRCGSLALGEEDRRTYSLVTEKAPEPDAE